ncbi:MAG: hypothetical protein KC994_10410 [Candidatus Omnitrophica bacterium]|nr:hypothetical protein [Candidatus Omnitrophota bacterium]
MAEGGTRQSSKKSLALDVLIFTGWVYFLYLFVLNGFPVGYRSNPIWATAMYTTPGWIVFFVWTLKIWRRYWKSQKPDSAPEARPLLIAWSIESLLVFTPWVIFFGIGYGLPWTWYRHQEILDWGWGVVYVFLVPVFSGVFLATWMVSGYLRKRRERHD